MDFESLTCQGQCLFDHRYRFFRTLQVTLVIKNWPANARDVRDGVPSLGQEDPLEESMKPTPVFLSGESHEQRSLVG